MWFITTNQNIKQVKRLHKIKWSTSTTTTKKSKRATIPHKILWFVITVTQMNR